MEQPLHSSESRSKTSQTYRERIYARYASERTPSILQFDEARYSRDAKGLLHRLGPWLPPALSSRCLDVACGAGQLLYALKSRGYLNIVGIDVSPEQVTMARRVWPHVHEVDAISYLQGNPASFDLITALDIIEHFRKDEIFDFLDAAYAALRVGGRLVVQTPNAESPWGLMHRYHDLTHELAFDPFSLAQTLSLAGFGRFEARECGPYIHGLRSLVRWLLWRGIRTGLWVWSVAETGSSGSGIYSRVFIAKSDKLPRHPGLSNV